MRTIVEAANPATCHLPARPTGLSMEMRLGDKSTLYQLAAETGGARSSTPTTSRAASNGVRRQHRYYVLGYTPTRTEDDGKYHKITVR